MPDFLTYPTYEVGGCVRDELLGLESKDIDYAVEAPSFEAMHEALDLAGFSIFLSTPEHFTVRARFPRGHEKNPLTADFVLCRKEGAYSDGRHPDEVEVGTILDDLARRDFTVNAMAKNWMGELIDPWNGFHDLDHRILRCVGSAEDRLREDALRGLRAIRFMITKGFTMDFELARALNSTWLPEALSSVSKERQREELEKAFKHDTLLTLNMLHTFPRLSRVIFSDGLRLMPTLRG